MKPAATRALRRFLLATCSLCVASPALAQVSTPDAGAPVPVAGGPVAFGAEASGENPSVVGSDGQDRLQPAPNGTLDNAQDITGVGQMFVRPNPASFGLSLCTGTLINPRAVIFAAHCVNGRAAEAYGSNTGGVPISFGFKANNLAGVRKWLGLDGGPLHATNAALAMYNVEQVWYDPRSTAATSCTGLGSCFLEADVAIATLDTHASGVPTWALLFSPLDGPTHVTVNGYGASGTGAAGANFGIDFRRRAAENMLDVLGSLADRNDFLFGGTNGNPQNLYQLDFDSPAGEAAYDPSQGRYDFDVFNGAALPREGIAAGGDSGGPLIVDERFDRPVVAGVLSGSSRFFGGQPFSSYGSTSFYQPLFMFWESIVANNPYVYATTKGGYGEWTDPRHWVQAMDPAYQVIVDGKLVNALPGFGEPGITGATPKFGEVCFRSNCVNIADDPEAQALATGTPNSIFVPGGPGSTDFVPNNVVADPRIGRKARYFDVTLSQGITGLGDDITIDRLTLEGQTFLDIRRSGSLSVLADYSQFGGALNIDGILRSGEALLGEGLLTGTGTFDPTYLTVVRGVIWPGGRLGTDMGTLTIQGDLVLSSGAVLLMDANRSGTDRLVVTGDGQNSGIASLGGTVIFIRKAGAAPRHGQSFEFLTASGGVQGTFDNVLGALGVLQPTLTYGANAVTVELRAGKLSQHLQGTNASALAFANALDGLRAKGYGKLYNLYGSIDLMDGASLSQTLAGLAPMKLASATVSLADRQSDALLGTVANRLSGLGASGTTGTLSAIGAPGAAMALAGGRADAASLAALGGSSGFATDGRAIAALPYGMSGFVSGGATATGSSAALGSEQRTRHFGMGLEMPVGENGTFGTAFGYSDGFGSLDAGGNRSESRVSQAAAYGNYRLGGGVYVAALGAFETGRLDLDRRTFDGNALLALTGATESTRASAMAEAGVNLSVAKGLTLTPRAGLEFSSLRLAGFEERGGETALRLDDLNVKRFEARIGTKLAGTTSLRGGWTLSPQLTADYRQALGNGQTGMRARFAAASDEAILLPFGHGDRSWGEVAGGLRLQNGPLAFGAGLETSVGRTDWNDSRAVADVSFRF